MWCDLLCTIQRAVVRKWQRLQNEALTIIKAGTGIGPGPKKIISIGITVNNERTHSTWHWQYNLYQCVRYEIYEVLRIAGSDWDGRPVPRAFGQPVRKWPLCWLWKTNISTLPSLPPNTLRMRCSFLLLQPLSSWMHSWHWAVRRGQLLCSPFANEAIKSILPWCRRDC